MKYRYTENGTEATALLFLSNSPFSSTCFQLLSSTLLIHLTTIFRGTLILQIQIDS